MLQVNYMKPFYTKITGRTLRLVFAYQYFSVTKQGEIYYFIPMEGKEICVNMDTWQIENLSEVFVFQKGNRFLRLPLYELMLMSNVQDHLLPMLESVALKVKGETPVTTAPPQEQVELSDFELQLLQRNYNYLIDCALDDGNATAFYALTQAKLQLEGQAS